MEIYEILDQNTVLVAEQKKTERNSKSLEDGKVLLPPSTYYNDNDDDDYTTSS